MIYSLLGPLIIVTCCVLKYLRFILRLEKVHSPPGAQLEISSKKGRKNVPFLTGEKQTYFDWRHYCSMISFTSKKNGKVPIFQATK
jgi:hypothetical protein